LLFTNVTPRSYTRFVLSLLNLSFLAFWKYTWGKNNKKKSAADTHTPPAVSSSPQAHTFTLTVSFPPLKRLHKHTHTHTHGMPTNTHAKKNRRSPPPRKLQREHAHTHVSPSHSFFALCSWLSFFFFFFCHSSSFFYVLLMFMNLRLANWNHHLLWPLSSYTVSMVRMAASSRSWR